MIYVADAIMGAGKTSASINLINGADGRFMFATPFLSECDRIKTACPTKDFCAPESKKGSKTDDAMRLIDNGRNIVTTHELFKRFNSETLRTIKAQEYTLILDEVIDPIREYELGEKEIKFLCDARLISIKNGLVSWSGRAGDGGRYADIKRLAEMSCLYVYGGTLLYWEFPVRMFDAFKDVYILTYMFDGAPINAYFRKNNIAWQTLYISGENGNYVFSETKGKSDEALKLQGLVHICQNAKMNEIGDLPTALSSTWSKRALASGDETTDRLRKNMYNFFRKINDASASDVMWTTYKRVRGSCAPRGYAKAFVPCTVRAVNTYADRHYLAYCVNRYMTPLTRNLLCSCEGGFDEDRYALSEAVQWVWRSAIRRGEEIYLYIPSQRMRKLFTEWLASVGGQPL